jgi:hypothetical protein
MSAVGAHRGVRCSGGGRESRQEVRRITPPISRRRHGYERAANGVRLTEALLTYRSAGLDLVVTNENAVIVEQL